MTRRSVPVALAALLTFSATFAQTERDVHDSFTRGNELKKAGKYPEAEQEYQRCFTMALRVYGEEHKNTAVLLHAMGNLYERLGKLDAAEKVYVRGLKIRGAAGDPNIRPDDSKGLLDADQVAGSVVDDRDDRTPRPARTGRLGHPRAPFVDGTPVRRGSSSQAPRIARPSALNAASQR